MEKHKLFHENGITGILASSITILGVPLLEGTSHPSQVTGARSCWFTCLAAESRSSHSGALGGGAPITFRLFSDQGALPPKRGDPKTWAPAAHMEAPSCHSLSV